MASSEKGGMSASIKAWLRLVRIEHALMSMVGVGIGLLLALKAEHGIVAGTCPLGILIGRPCFDSSWIFTWVFALAVPFFINLASFALNDYFDIEADRKNGHLKRPLVSGALKPNVAIITAVMGYLAGFIAGWLLNPLSGIIATLFILLSIAYNYKLKDWPLVGNAYIALSMAVAFPFGAAAIGIGLEQLPLSIIWLTLGAFFAGLARELIKSVQDMEGDKAARHSKHLPILIGASNTLTLAFFSVAAFCVCILQLVGVMKEWPYTQFLLILSGMAYAAIAVALWKWPEREYLLELARKGSLYALMLALLAVLLAVI